MTSQRQTRTVLIVFIALIALVVLWRLQPGRARFQWETSDAWGARLGDPDEETRTRARQTLVRGGPRAVPVLVDVLGDGDALARVTAAEALGRIGLAAREAGPALLAAVSSSDSGLRRAAIHALGRTGTNKPGLVARLMEFLASEDRVVRQGAMRALGRCGPAGATAAGDLGQVAADGEERSDMRFTALLAINAIGPAATAAEADVRSVLESGDPLLSALAASALARIDPVDTTAIPVLLALLEGPQDTAFLAVISAAQIGPRARAAGPLIARRFANARPGQDAMIAFAFARISDDPEPHVRTLEGLLDSDEPGVSRASIFLLGCLGPAATPAASALERLVRDAEVGPVARQALRRIRGIEKPPADLWTLSR